MQNQCIFLPDTNEFYTGHRTNAPLIVYDTKTLQQKDIIAINCNGIFYQSYNFINQLWVVCAIYNRIPKNDKLKLFCNVW